MYNLEVAVSRCGMLVFTLRVSVGALFSLVGYNTYVLVG
jgi:hypothetical protein